MSVDLSLLEYNEFNSIKLDNEWITGRIPKYTYGILAFLKHNNIYYILSEDDGHMWISFKSENYKMIQDFNWILKELYNSVILKPNYKVIFKNKKLNKIRKYNQSFTAEINIVDNRCTSGYLIQIEDLNKNVIVFDASWLSVYKSIEKDFGLI